MEASFRIRNNTRSFEMNLDEYYTLNEKFAYHDGSLYNSWIGLEYLEDSSR